jgi:hypothetical protein
VLEGEVTEQSPRLLFILAHASISASVPRVSASDSRISPTVANSSASRGGMSIGDACVIHPSTIAGPSFSCAVNGARIDVHRHDADHRQQ